MATKTWVCDGVTYFDHNCCVEPVSKQVERLEKELADLKAKAAAEAVKPKTVGEALAANLVTPQGDKCEFVTLPGAWGYRFFGSHPPADALASVHKNLAKAFDKAVEEAKAEQREKDAAICDLGAEWYKDFSNSAATAQRARAYDIRNNK